MLPVSSGKAGVIELLLPDNLRQALHLASDGRPNAEVRRSYPTADQRRTRRRIWQHLRHTGAVNARWLSQDLGVDAIAIDVELAWLGFIRIDGDWYGAPRVLMGLLSGTSRCCIAQYARCLSTADL